MDNQHHQRQQYSNGENPTKATQTPQPHDPREHLHAPQLPHVHTTPGRPSRRVLHPAFATRGRDRIILLRGHHRRGRRVPGATVQLTDGGGDGDRPDGGQGADDHHGGLPDDPIDPAALAECRHPGPRRRPSHLRHLLPLDQPTAPQDLFPLLGLQPAERGGPPHGNQQDQHLLAAVARRERHVVARLARGFGRSLEFDWRL